MLSLQGFYHFLNYKCASPDSKLQVILEEYHRLWDKMLSYYAKCFIKTYEKAFKPVTSSPVIKR